MSSPHNMPYLVVLLIFCCSQPRAFVAEECTRSVLSDVSVHTYNILSWLIPCLFFYLLSRSLMFLDVIFSILSRIFSHHSYHSSYVSICFNITSDLFMLFLFTIWKITAFFLSCTNHHHQPPPLEAARPISRYFPRVSEKLVLAAAAEELERAPPRQVGKSSLREI